MSGLYFHIPFCQKACHYCNFYFVLSKNKENEFIDSLVKEIELKEKWLSSNNIDTIYFGGGTPSILSNNSLTKIISAIHRVFNTKNTTEITLEANPEDITIEKLLSWKSSGINRLSIGVQSFFNEDLQSMNRAHNSFQAHEAIKLAKNYFENISIDLMFGLPLLTNEHWKQNIAQVAQYDIPHISCYNLTVEEKTSLERKIRKKEIQLMPEDIHINQFFEAEQYLESMGYIHYEISNYGKSGFESKHNQSYWNQIEYLGFGPSAHSYFNNKRTWNVNNLNEYIKRIENQVDFFDSEILTVEDLYNEYVMTHIRTRSGVDLVKLKLQFGNLFFDYFCNEIIEPIKNGFLEQDINKITLSSKGKMISDKISSDLMYV